MDWLIFLLAIEAALSGSSDADLVAALSKGDEAAFEKLFHQYHTDLFRFLVRHGVTPEASEDILQDVFAAVWRGKDRLDPARSIRAYLYRACRNRAANYFRGAARTDEASVEEAPSRLPQQDDQLDYEMLHERLHGIIERLPERRRAVFELCFLGGLSYREASETLGITPKTVENQMGHALKTIRAALAPFLDRGP
jgi:RNA polymerase sigma-70 factor (ECF subfamily)